MNKRLVLKLLPVALIAVIGFIWAANAPPRAEAGISSVTAASSTVPTTISVGAENGAGVLTVNAPGGILTCSVSCSGSGTSSVSVDLGTSVSKSAATVQFGLNANCVAGGVITVFATQGAGSVVSTSGSTTVTCGFSCVNQLTLGCCNNGLVGGCGCFNGITTGVLGCGCGGVLGTNGVILGNGLVSNCGCGSVLGTNGVIINNGLLGTGVLGNGFNCGCGSTVLGTGGLLLGGNGFANCAGVTQVTVTVPGSGQCGSSTNVLVTVRNAFGGVGIDGIPVTLISTMGTISPQITQTSGGIAAASLLLPATASGTATITATAGGLTGSASMAVGCAVQPAPAFVPQPVAPPRVVAPVIIAAPNAGDGGCLVDPRSCGLSDDD